MAIPASYQAEMSAAMPGMIADTSLYNVDGACAAGGEIQLGVAVAVTGTDPVSGIKTVAQISGASQVAYGVAMRSHWQAPTGVYVDADAVNVVTHGRIWVFTKDTTAPAFGANVQFDVDGLHKQGGAVATGWTFAGGFSTFRGERIIEIQVLQNAAVPAAAGA